MSLMSDVTHQVKHPPICTIHSPFKGGLKSVFFLESQKCVKTKTCYAYMSSSLVGSSSSGGGGVERGRVTNRLQRWQCGGIMHDMHYSTPRMQ